MRFSDRIKQQQRQWADEAGFEPSWFDARPSRRHVLVHRHRTRNLFDPFWWRYIEGKEHRWVAALNSSQCFAVNLFAPLAVDEFLARKVFARLAPTRLVMDSQSVTVAFEYSPSNGAEWLGEKTNGQGTQVDVLLTIVDEQGAPVGHVLVEVKLSETEFGGCRGAKPNRSGQNGNPLPDRCLNLGEVMASPVDQCWIVEAEGRRYWERMAKEDSSFMLDRVSPKSPCPFRHGLYQLMRNRVLADALTKETSAEWADFAICVHPDNDAAQWLKEPVCGERDVGRAFRQIVEERSLLDLNPAHVVATVEKQDSKWKAWANWMRNRYLLEACGKI